MANTRSTEAARSKRPASDTSNTTTKGRAAIRGGKPTGRQSNRTSRDISQAELATYKLVHARLEADKQANKEAQDAAIRARNRELLEEDEDSQVDDRRPSKRKKTINSPQLSDSEEDLAAGLGSVRAVALSRQAGVGLLPDEEEDDAQHSSNEDAGDAEELPADWDGIDVDDVDADMDLAPGDGELTNEIAANDPQDDAVSKRNHKQSNAPKTPRSKAPSNANASNNTSKVVEKDFTPRTLKLALASKSHVRTRTIFDEPFPRNNKISRINFAWNTIKESALNSEDAEVRLAYKRATINTAIKTKLMKFTLYGRTGLVSSIISKARDKVRAYYGFAGDADLVRKDVEWLLKDSHFVYGGIDLRQRTVDQMKPFGAQLIIDIIEAQWFPSTSRSKLDLETTNRIYRKRDLPLTIVLLVVTAIEHALKEWCTNGRKATQITFSEETAKLSYERHLRHWKIFESQMKAWPAWWRRTILAQILANHSNFDLNTDDNDFANLDFGALDRLAGFEEEGINEEIGGGDVRAELEVCRERARVAREAREAREARRGHDNEATSERAGNESNCEEGDDRETMETQSTRDAARAPSRNRAGAEASGERSRSVARSPVAQNVDCLTELEVL